MREDERRRRRRKHHSEPVKKDLKHSLHNIKLKAIDIWKENKFECISVGVLIVAAAVALPFIVSSVKKTSPAPTATTADVNLEDYGSLFADDEGSGKNGNTKTSSNGIRVKVDEETDQLSFFDPRDPFTGSK